MLAVWVLKLRLDFPKLSQRDAIISIRRLFEGR